MSVLDKLEEVIGAGRIRKGERFVGGVAELYIELEKTEDLIRLVPEARALGLPIYVFGTGSKALFADRGLSGLVIKNNCRKFDKASIRGTIRENQVGVADVLVSAEAGVIMNQLVRFTIEEGLEGLEYQLGMSGTVGGAIYTNAKYAPKNILARSHLYSVRILDTDGEVHTFTGDLPYFVNLDEEFETKEVILSTVFKLAPYDKKILWERGREAVEWRSKQ